MGTRLRLWEQHGLYEGVHGCVDRQFVLKPCHHFDQPLLRWDCPLEALEPSNDILPVPSTINIIGSSVVRALELHPVKLHWFEANLNHAHVGLSPKDGRTEEVSLFLQAAFSSIARQVNGTYDREGHLFGARGRYTPCLDDEATAQKLVYALSNAVKDGQVESVAESPFFSTYRNQAFGEELKFWDIDWAGWWAAGGPRNKRHRPKDYLKWKALEITPPPELAAMPDHKRQTFVRQSVREVEEECAEQRQAEGRSVVGLPALFAIDPRSRPNSPRKNGWRHPVTVAVQCEVDTVHEAAQVQSGRRARSQTARSQPLCHTADPELKRDFARKWREFLREHRRASIDFLNGMWEREFPVGSFRPPITTVYQHDLAPRPPPDPPPRR